MSSSFNKMLDKAYHGQPASQLLEASPDALRGVSSGDAQHLSQAFGVNTVRKLAQLKYADQARAILAADGLPSHDPGPPPAWDSFFHTAPLAHYQTHPDRRFRLDFGPVYYRGRLDGSARLLVVGQDPATNEILAHRAFVGTSGQRLQRFLEKIGITRSYIMFNTFLYSIFGQFDTEMRSISLEPTVLNYRNAFFDKIVGQNNIQAIVASGAGAQHAVDHWPGRGSIPVFEIQHPSARDSQALLASWSAALPGLGSKVDPDDGTVPDLTPYGDTFTDADAIDIPRFDLPFGLPNWHGANGGHSTRDGNDKIIWKTP